MRHKVIRMKKIEAIVRPERLEQIKKALQKTGAMEKLDVAYRRPVLPGQL